MTIKQEVLEAAKTLSALFKEGDDKRDAGLPHDIPEVERFDNIAYGPKEKWNLLDIYLPKKRIDKVPTIINIHGGGWVYGTKETYQFFGLSLAKEGFAFVNFNYQLAPEVEFPGELDDVNRAVHWVASHGSDYDIDLNNIFIIGDSAGGQMAVQYLTILTNNTTVKNLATTNLTCQCVQLLLTAELLSSTFLVLLKVPQRLTLPILF